MNRPESRRELLAVCAIFSLALLVRLVYLAQSASNPAFDLPLVDSETYDRIARHLASGGPVTRELFWQPVFYPLFLSGVYALTGASALAARLVQIVLGAVTCCLTYKLGCTLQDRRTGVAAGLITSLYGPLIFFDAELLATGWAGFWSVALILLVLHLARPLRARGASEPHRRLVACGVLGVCLALATLTRPTFLPFAAIAAVWLVGTWGKRGVGRAVVTARSLTLVAGFLAVAAPVAWACGNVTGRASILPASAGINLYLGNNPDRTASIAIRPGWQWEKLTRSPRQHGVTEQQNTSSYFSGIVLDYARDEPFGFATGLLAKSGQMVSSRELPRNLDPYLFRQWSTLLSVLLWKIGRFGFPFGVLLPLAVLGLLRLQPQARLPLFLYLLPYAGAVILVFVSARYRTPIIPPLAVPAACGAIAAFDAIRGASWHRLARGSALAIGVALAASMPGPFPQERGNFEAEFEYLLGLRAADRGEFDAAVRHEDRALALEPAHADAHTTLGNVLSEQGQRARAIEHYEMALAVDPSHATARANLARSLARDGNRDDALRHLALAIESTPFDTELYEDVATILAWQGRLDQALDYLSRAIEIRPDDADLRYRAGRVLAGLGRLTQAQEQLETALAQDELNRDALEALVSVLVRQGRRDDAAARLRSSLATAVASGHDDTAEWIRGRLRAFE